jgi:long-chain fatty acid transport protein
MPTTRGLVLVVALALPGRAARADDTNYQNLMPGQRALGMGGAFTALADDASAPFYNPAGATWIENTSLSTALNVYGVDRLRVTRGFTAVLDSEPVSVDFNTRGLAALPTTLAFAKTFGRAQPGGGKQMALGVAIFLRDDSRRSVAEVLQGPASRGSFTQAELDRTLWIGPAFAYRVLPQLGVGATLIFSHRSVRRSRTSAFETEDPACTPPGCPSLEVRIDDELVQYSSGELFLRAGARFDAGSRLHLGLTMTTPSVHVRGSGNLIGTHALTMIDPATGQGTADYDPRANRGLEVANPQGLEVRAGVAYGEAHRWLGSADVTLHAGHDYDPVAMPDPDDPDTAIVSFLHVPTVTRETVVNLNLGGEFHAGRVPLRAGLFTNFSSAPEVREAAENQLPHLDMYGVTASVGYISRGDFELSIGALYAFGTGDYAAWDPEAGAGGAYVPTRARRDSVYFYVSGASKMAKRLAKKVSDRLRGGQNPPPETDVKGEP